MQLEEWAAVEGAPFLYDGQDYMVRAAACALMQCLLRVHTCISCMTASTPWRKCLLCAYTHYTPTV